MKTKLIEVVLLKTYSSMEVKEMLKKSILMFLLYLVAMSVNAQVTAPPVAKNNLPDLVVKEISSGRINGFNLIVIASMVVDLIKGTGKAIKKIFTA